MLKASVISTLIHCANLFKFAAIDDVLSSLGVSDEIKQFVLNQPKNKMNYYVTVLERSNIKSVDELEYAVSQLLQSADEFDMKVASKLQGLEAREWALNNLRKLRKHNPIFDYKKFQTMFPAWYNFVQWLTGEDVLLGAGGLLPAELQFDRQSFMDWYNIGVTNVNSMSIEQAAKNIYEWHKKMAEEGEGLKYKEGTAHIVYGPKWKNDAFNGWTIRKVTTENDLKTEGNKMNHCVGSYCNAVEVGNSIIYSLRDPKNEPHVTIEGEPKYSSKKEIDNISFAQIYGHSNSEPKAQYKEMIKEWFKSMLESGKKIYMSDDVDINERIYEAAQNFKYEYRPPSDWLDKVVFANENEYGVIPRDSGSFSFESAYDSIIAGFKNRNNNYYGSMGYAASPLVKITIDADIRLANELDEKSMTEEDLGKLWVSKSQTESMINIVQGNNETLFDNLIDYYPGMPEETDFEDPDDYKQAFENYENEVKYIDEEARKRLPHAFDDDLMEELSKQIKSLPLRPWMKNSSVWHYLK